MKPWSKVSNRAILETREDRIADGRAASTTEVLSELGALTDDDRMPTSFRLLAKGFGWTRSRLIRALQIWDGRGWLIFVGDPLPSLLANQLNQEATEPVSNIRARANQVDDDKQGIVEPTRTTNEPVSNIRARSSPREIRLETEREHVPDGAPDLAVPVVVLEQQETPKAEPVTTVAVRQPALLSQGPIALDLVIKDARLRRRLLEQAEVSSTEQLTAMTKEDLASVSGMGAKSVKAVERFLKAKGLSLREEVVHRDLRHEVVWAIWKQVHINCLNGEKPRWDDMAGGKWERERLISIANTAELTRTDYDPTDPAIIAMENAFRAYLGNLTAHHNWPFSPTIVDFCRRLSARFTGNAKQAIDPIMTDRDLDDFIAELEGDSNKDQPRLVVLGEDD